jgi:hypothetical protein
MTTRKSKRQKLAPYDFLAIPLRDGSFGLAEFVGKGDSGERFKLQEIDRCPPASS